MYSADPNQLKEHPPVEWLRLEFQARRLKNPKYSLRNFARALLLSPSRLSDFLAGKRPLTRKAGIKIAERLGYPPDITDLLLEKISGRKKPERKTPAPWVAAEIRPDIFELVANWQHFAVYNLIRTAGFESSPKWIAKRIGASVIEVRGVIERLQRVGMLKEEDGKLMVAEQNTTTTHDIPSAALRRLHKGHLEKAIAALEDVSVDKRDITGVTMAIDPDKLPEAKKKIAEFRRSMSGFLEEGQRKEVYHLGIQLFPLSHSS